MVWIQHREVQATPFGSPHLIEAGEDTTDAHKSMRIHGAVLNRNRIKALKLSKHWHFTWEDFVREIPHDRKTSVQGEVFYNQINSWNAFQ